MSRSAQDRSARSIDYRTLLRTALAGDDEATVLDDMLATRILATRIPGLCPDCKGSGNTSHLAPQTTSAASPYPPPNIEVIVLGCTHPNAPTIADLLRWGENVAKAEEMPDPHMVHGPYADGWNACLAALRTEADR